MCEARVGSSRGLVVGEGPRASRSEGDDRVVSKSLSGLVECHVTLGQLFFL